MEETKTKCPNCRHDADMHWFPGCPGIPDFMSRDEYPTTACRDCLPINLYPMRLEDGPHKGMVINGGMCTWTRETVERVFDV